MPNYIPNMFARNADAPQYVRWGAARPAGHGIQWSRKWSRRKLTKTNPVGFLQLFQNGAYRSGVRGERGALAIEHHRNRARAGRRHGARLESCLWRRSRHRQNLR